MERLRQSAIADAVQALSGRNFIQMNEMRLDERHDVSLSGNSIARFRDSGRETVRERTGQLCLCLLRTEEGESFIDGTHGVPWFGKILGLPVQHLDVAARIVREKLASLREVKKVVKVTLRADGRNLGGSFSVQTSDGTVAKGDF